MFAGPPLRRTPPNISRFSFNLPPQNSFLLLSLRIFSWTCGRRSRPWATQNARLCTLQSGHSVTLSILFFLFVFSIFRIVHFSFEIVFVFFPFFTFFIFSFFHFYIVHFCYFFFKFGGGITTSPKPNPPPLNRCCDSVPSDGFQQCRVVVREGPTVV